MNATWSLVVACEFPEAMLVMGGAGDAAAEYATVEMAGEEHMGWMVDQVLFCLLNYPIAKD